MRELFENEGHRAGQYFETSAAIEIERNVLLELTRRADPLRLRLRASVTGRASN